MGYKLKNLRFITLDNLLLFRDALDAGINAIYNNLYRQLNSADSNLSDRINQTNEALVDLQESLQDQIDNIEAPHIPELPSNVRVYTDVRGTQAQNSNPYYATRYDVTDDTVTSYLSKMIVFIKTPCAGSDKYGTALQINNLGYHPIVYGYDKMIGTRYDVGDMIVAIYDSLQAATLYLGKGKVTVTGAWRALNFSYDRVKINNSLGYNSGTRSKTGNLQRDMLCVVSKDGVIIPLNQNGGTGTTKPMTTSEFCPQKGVFYYPGLYSIPSGSSIPMSSLCRQYNSVHLNASFNCGSTLTANKEIYLVMEETGGGLCKLAATPWSQSLPNRADGKLYMLLGVASSSTFGELYSDHPIFWHDGRGIKTWTGGAIMVHGANEEVDTSSVEVTFSGLQRNSKMITVYDDVSISIKIDSLYSVDNILWVKNDGDEEIEITVSVLTREEGANYIEILAYLPSGGIRVPAGHVSELKVIVSHNGVFITSSDLAPAQ